MKKDTKISLRISEQEKEAIEIVAALKDIPVAQLMREAIREYLKEDRK